MSEGNHKSASYVPLHGDYNCGKLQDNTPEDPCWGEVCFADPDEYVFECQGHYNWWDDLMSDRPELIGYKYKPDPTSKDGN